MNHGNSDRDDDDVNSPEARTARSLKARLCVMMFLQYFVEGCYLPIISVYPSTGVRNRISAPSDLTRSARSSMKA